MKIIVKAKQLKKSKGWRSTKWDILRLMRSGEECIIVTDLDGDKDMTSLGELNGEAVTIGDEDFTIAGTEVKKTKEEEEGKD